MHVNMHPNSIHRSFRRKQTTEISSSRGLIAQQRSFRSFNEPITIKKKELGELTRVWSAYEEYYLRQVKSITNSRHLQSGLIISSGLSDVFTTSGSLEVETEMDQLGIHPTNMPEGRAAAQL